MTRGGSHCSRTPPPASAACSSTSAPTSLSRGRGETTSVGPTSHPRAGAAARRGAVASMYSASRSWSSMRLRRASS
eukprot:scaffold42577_cov57-Phaeocystis_antarctica.AAC.2